MSRLCILTLYTLQDVSPSLLRDLRESLFFPQMHRNSKQSLKNAGKRSRREKRKVTWCRGQGTSSQTHSASGCSPRRVLFLSATETSRGAVTTSTCQRAIQPSGDTGCFLGSELATRAPSMCSLAWPHSTQLGKNSCLCVEKMAVSSVSTGDVLSFALLRLLVKNLPKEQDNNRRQIFT